MNAAPVSPPAKSGLLARLKAAPAAIWAFARKKPLLAIGGSAGAALVICLGLMTTLWLFASQEEKASQATLEQGLTALESGRLDDARLIAVSLRAANKLPPDERGGPAFILGAAMSLTAETAPNPDEQRNLHEIAVKYLQEAADIGFPAGFEAEGAYRLGESLFRIDRFAQAIPRLQTALKLKHPEKVDIHRMLATAYFLDSEPNLKEALAHNQALLDEKALSDEQLEGALLQQAEIAFRLGNDALLSEALALVSRAAEGSPISIAGKVLNARALIRDAASRNQDDEAIVKQARARDLLLEVLARSGAPRESQAEAAFFLGKLDFAEKKLDAALVMFGRARRLAGGSALVAAITLEEGDVHLARSQGTADRADAAVASFRRVLKPMDPNKPFVNPWIARGEVSQRVGAAVEQLLNDREYASALELNKALSLATDSPEALKMMGEIEMAWGRALQAQVIAKAGVDLDRAKAAREHLLRAAIAYQALAERKLATREYASLMQQSAKLFEEGRDYEAARKALTRTLDVQGRNERPETLVMLGKVLLDLDRLEEAVTALTECYLSFRRNPVSYRARLLASRALFEQGKMDEAKQLLHANLWEEDLSPQSADWRDSLFALADVLFAQARVAYAMAKEKAAIANVARTEVSDAFDAAARLFDEAAQRLSEAVARYPESDQAVLARYQLAECNRCLARNKMRLHDAHPIQTAKTQFEREAKAYLASALTDLGIVQTQLNQRADTRELTPTERKLLRNCYFLTADCLFDRKEYEAAIQAYADAAGRYQTEPAAIEAFAQIAASYRWLKRPSDEHTAIEQALAMLGRLPLNADFSTTTRASRGEWNDYLTWRATTR
jgi:TolA-binding protein